MRVLVACEFSGIVRDAFADKGHYAVSCDLIPSESSHGHHHVGDVVSLLHEGWDLMIAHPPCQYLCGSGMHWNSRRPERNELTAKALKFVKILWDAPIHSVCLENPIGILSTYFNKPSQIIQPFQFGHDASKKTCLWLRNLPLLEPTEYIAPRVVQNGRHRWANQTDSGQNKLAPSEHRSSDRSRTYKGIAQAMANQWG